MAKKKIVWIEDDEDVIEDLEQMDGHGNICAV